jgi:uncharacterized protein (TIRG00374 family)
MSLSLPKLPVRKHLFRVLKIIVPLAIIGWLLASVEAEKWQELRDQPKNWWMLALGFSLALTAISISFVRWFVLVRVTGISFRLRDAFRLGFLGFLLNFVSVGSVGGDLFKAYFLAKENRGQRAKAVASVLIDRLMGLYALLLVATTGFLLSGLSEQSTELAMLARLVYMATALGAFCMFGLLIPGFTNGKLTRTLTNIPKLGGLAARLIAAVRIYRERWLALAISLVMSIAVQGLLATSVYLAASSLFEGVPTLGQHLIVVPVSLVVAAVPVSPAGLGTFEVALEELYKLLSGAAGPPGITVALVFRLMTIGVAAVGVCYYLASRREVKQLLAEASGGTAQGDACTVDTDKSYVGARGLDPSHAS